MDLFTSVRTENLARVTSSFLCPHFTRTFSIQLPCVILSQSKGQAAGCKDPLSFIFQQPIFFIWPNRPQWAWASSVTRFLDHTQRRTTVGRTHLDE